MTGSEFEAILAGLDSDQQAAARATRGPVCILAGAGTGKTRAITHRIAYGVRTGDLPPGQVLALTFTARAAGELRTRLRALGVGGVQARTFHAAALRQLTYFAPRVLGGSAPQVLGNPLRLVGQAASAANVRVDRAQLRDVAAEIDWAKAVLARPGQYPARADLAGRVSSVPAVAVAEIYDQYEQLKGRTGVLDFADLLLVVAAAIESEPHIADEVRARYRHFVVDEYQDVSPVQQRVLDAWLGDRDDLCVVGDPNQTIYSFAGASSGQLLQFPRRFPEALVIRLTRDYRSTPQVVAFANALMRANRAPSTRSGTPAEQLRLIGQRPPGPEPAIEEFDDEPAEAAAVAAACQRLIEAGTPAAQIAVLFRVNAQSEVYEQAFGSAGIPYLLRGGERFFDRPEIKQARVLLRGSARTGSPLNPPGTASSSLPEQVSDLLAAVGWSPGAPPAGGTSRERWESLAALVRLAEELAVAVPGAGLAELAIELDARAEAQHAPTVQGVTLASLHAAKGLEWDAVFLVGVTDSTLPIAHATTPEQVAEERRLLYVGITRARERLTISWAAARSPGQRRSRRRSRFLDDLRPASPAARPAKRRSVVPAAADAETFARLRAWRKRQADAQQVPAYVVFSDSTLVAIADAAPASRTALARVGGVGAVKLERYADAVLAVVAGADPAELAITAG